MPTSGSGRRPNVSENEQNENPTKFVVVKIQHDGYVAFLQEGQELLLVTAGDLNKTNHDCEIDRSHFPPLDPEVQVRVFARDPHSWSGRMVFHGVAPEGPEGEKPQGCPRCAIDPQDCIDHG